MKMKTPDKKEICRLKAYESNRTQQHNVNDVSSNRENFASKVTLIDANNIFGPGGLSNLDIVNDSIIVRENENEDILNFYRDNKKEGDDISIAKNNRNTKNKIEPNLKQKNNNNSHHIKSEEKIIKNEKNKMIRHASHQLINNVIKENLSLFKMNKGIVIKIPLNDNCDDFKSAFSNFTKTPEAELNFDVLKSSSIKNDLSMIGKRIISPIININVT